LRFECGQSGQQSAGMVAAKGGFFDQSGAKRWGNAGTGWFLLIDSIFDE
jgi:hypothetical protein